MALTPNSSATAYAAPSDLFLRYDIRTIADLVSDTGSRLGGSPNPNAATVAASPRLLTLLLVNSGRVEASCVKGQRYLPTDLQALTGVSKQYLVQIVCALTMGDLFRARPDIGKPDETYQEACESLKALADGEQIFAFVETEAAGVMENQVNTPGDVENRFLTTVQMRRLFGRRNNESVGPGPGPFPGCWGGW